MGKNAKNANNINATNTEEKTPMPTAPTPEPAAEPELETAIVLAPDAELAVAEDNPYAMTHLAPSLPHLAKILNSTFKPSEEEFATARGNLPEADQRAFELMIDKMNPTRAGMHVDNMQFRANSLRLYQGTGNDQARPEACLPGGVYSETGEMIFMPGSMSKMLGVGEYIDVAVVGYYTARQMWLPKDSKGNPIPIPGIEVKGNAPVCTSLDRKKGERFGDCHVCPHRPFAHGKYDPQACKDEVQLYVVLRGFQGIYQIKVTSTSVKSGATPIFQKVRGWRNMWDYYFRIETKAMTSGDRRWFVWSTSVATDRDHPLGVPVDAATREICALISRQVDCEIYYPGLSRIYSRAEAVPTVKADESADKAAMLAAATATPDHSQNI